METPAQRGIRLDIAYTEELAPFEKGVFFGIHHSPWEFTGVLHRIAPTVSEEVEFWNGYRSIR